MGVLAAGSFSAVSLGIAALAPALRGAYGLSFVAVGLVLAATNVGSVLTLLAWGVLADRVGERVVVLVGLLGAAAGLVGVAYATSFAALVGLLVVAGLFGASVNAASGRAVMAWFAAEERGLALGIRQTAIPLGGAVGAAVLPRIAVAGGLRAAFLVLGAGCAGAGLAGGVWLRERPAGRALEGDAGRPLRDLRMWRLAWGSSLMVVAQFSILRFVVLFLHEARGVAVGTAAVVLAVLQVTGAALRIVSGRWSDRTGSRLRPLRLLALVLAVSLGVSAALVRAPLSALVPVLVVTGALGLSWNGLSFTAAAELAGRGRSGAALGFQQTALSVAGAVTPIAFAALVAGTSWEVGFALAALTPLAAWRILAPLD